MRLLLLFTLLFSFAYAKSKDTCYTVQLTSFKFKKNSSYNFTKKGYPDSCKLISFTNINAVRCGCYENYADAFEEKKKLQKTYRSALITTTYKYRFAPTMSLATRVTQTYHEKKALQETKKTEQIKPQNTNEITTPKEEQSPEIQEESFYDNLSVQGNIDLTTQFYLQRPKDKHADNYTASTELELGYIKDDIEFKTKLSAQQDYYDLKGTQHQTQRSFLRLDELYLQYEMENDQVKVGKDIKFWGALEVRNITDGFNPTDLRADPFYTDKLGVWNASFTHYTESGEVSLILKAYEQSRDMSAFPYVYYYFPETMNTNFGAVPLHYKDELITENAKTRPTLYLKYSGSTDTEYPLDFAIILQNGYDSQRYYSTDFSPATGDFQAKENAYIVNKIITYNTLVIDSTLYKLEAVYANVKSSNENNISDYIHLGLGVEHTLTQVYKEADLGLIAEYYYYDTLEKGKKTDLELFELFQNDLFLGLRYSFNEGNDASIITGAIFDLDYNEQVYYFEYESRIAEIVKLNFDYRYIQPSPTKPTAFHLMGAHERLSLKLGYYF